MKKLTEKRKRWLIVRARNQFRRSNRKALGRIKVTLWDGEEFVEALSERAPKKPPSCLSLGSNFEQTALFIERIRRRMLSRPRNRQKWAPRSVDGMRRLKGFYDFSFIREIDVAAALVLSAEYARMGELIGDTPPIINVDAWDKSVFNQLFEIGFFDVVNLNRPDEMHLEHTQQDTLSLKFFSGNQAEVEKADRALSALYDFACPSGDLSLEARLKVNSAISEAMSNVTRHAYPERFKFQYPHLNKWWMTGTADRRTKTVTIVFYDQGATIPVTYQELSLADAIWSFIGPREEASHLYHRDGKLIQAAAKYGNTQTNEPNRGKGLPQMIEVISSSLNGRLRILSRGGEYIHNSGGQERNAWHPTSIGGTLIEWTFQVG